VVVMDQEEALKRLQKTRKENEEAYLKAKAFLDGFRARGQLNQKDSEFLFLMEFVIKGFKNHGNDIITAFENQVRFTEAFNNLQLKVNDLEHEINHLKKTLDKMYQDR
jgi:prefoldin subunit 5